MTPALPPRVAASFAAQAEACLRLGSPLTARLSTAVPLTVGAAPALAGELAAWEGREEGAMLALRVAGGLHALVRAGRAPALARSYPPGRPGDGFEADLEATLTTWDAWLARFVRHPPQTNEVGRSGALLGGLLTVAAETGAAIRLREIGSSAGLNLQLDAYAYDLGDGRRWGPADAPVEIACAWRGPPPPLDAGLRIIDRAGADLEPLDPGDPAARERLMAFIWADQPHRLARTAAALDLAAHQRVRVARADAADWVEAELSAPPAPGVCTVLMHSIVWQYLPRATQDRIEAALQAAGSQARAESPLAWLRMERDGVPGTAAVSLTLWPPPKSASRPPRGASPGSGTGTRLLGRADFHGRSVEWMA